MEFSYGRNGHPYCVITTLKPGRAMFVCVVVQQVLFPVRLLDPARY